MSISDNTNTILNRIFTRNTIANIINTKDNLLFKSCVHRYLNNVEVLNNGQVFTELYKQLRRKYRNEYYYKNTLLNKLLLGKHSINTTSALTETPINKSKADFILINGKAVVYEIKTELDNFDRLENQIDDYYKAFNHVCVVTSESNYKKVNELLESTPVGIYILTNRNTISERKKPQLYNAKLEHSTIFKILRKKEFENVILDYYGYLPKTTQVNYYKACFELFSEINVQTAYHLFIRELKKRSKVEIDNYNHVPYELKFLIYFSNYTKDEYNKLFAFLNEQWRG